MYHTVSSAFCDICKLIYNNNVTFEGQETATLFFYNHLYWYLPKLPLLDYSKGLLLVCTRYIHTITFFWSIYTEDFN
jgi:hypothetical protein